MAVSLAETQALAELAEHLYDYLPGSSAWKGTYTFAHAAVDAGVGPFWQGGSKLPALQALLEQTYEQRQDAFCRLIEIIVRRGIHYRTRKQNPLTRQDIENLNRLVLKLGFKIPALWDNRFLSSLPNSASGNESSTSAQPQETSDQESEREKERLAHLAELRERFLSLRDQQDRQAAGLALESLLNELFAISDLDPHSPFRVAGEQIDGSFVIDSEVYILEAKWTERPVPEKDLLVFRGKVEGKSSFTRGLFLSVNGFSPDAVSALTKGKCPTFVMMDGADLFRVLEGFVRLDDLLRRKVRYLAERGEPYVPVATLFSNVPCDR